MVKVSCWYLFIIVVAIIIVLIIFIAIIIIIFIVIVVIIISLKFGELPDLFEDVSVVGYPVGGDSIS